MTLSLEGPVLVVDDDAAIVRFLETYLEALGCEVLTASDGHKALKILDKFNPSFVILDVMMPFQDGYETCRQIRKKSDSPILMLTAKIEETDKIRGLELGADDYLTKPFSPRELVARMQAILRRANRPLKNEEVSTPILRFGELTYDAKRHLFNWVGHSVYLTSQEAKIMIELLEKKGLISTREHLLNVLYPTGEEGAVDRIIDVHIGNIRQKLRAIDSTYDPIQTVRGIGYRLQEEKE